MKLRTAASTALLLCAASASAAVSPLHPSYRAQQGNQIKWFKRLTTGQAAQLRLVNPVRGVYGLTFKCQGDTLQVSGLGKPSLSDVTFQETYAVVPQDVTRAAAAALGLPLTTGLNVKSGAGDTLKCEKGLLWAKYGTLVDKVNIGTPSRPGEFAFQVNEIEQSTIGTPARAVWMQLLHKDGQYTIQSLFAGAQAQRIEVSTEREQAVTLRESGTVQDPMSKDDGQVLPLPSPVTLRGNTLKLVFLFPSRIIGVPGPIRATLWIRGDYSATQGDPRPVR